MTLDAFLNTGNSVPPEVKRSLVAASLIDVKAPGWVINAKVEGESVQINFAYNKHIVNYVKAIPGRRYDPSAFTWSFPKMHWALFQSGLLSLGRLIKCDINLTVSPEDLLTLTATADFKYSAIPTVDGFKGELYPFQAQGVGFLVTRQCALLADEMGLGKSVETIAGALELRRQGKIHRVLVFCPKTIIQQWVGEFERFTGEKACAVMGDKEHRLLQMAKGAGYFFVVTNYEMVLRHYKELSSLNPDLVVVDEAQRIGSYNAKTTQIIKQYFRAPYRWALSGTPLENALAELHSIMDWVDEGILGTWWTFSSRYLVLDEDKRVRGSKNLPELHGIIKDWMLRRRKAEVLQDLPALTVNTYHITLSPEERKLYRQIKDDLKTYYQLYKNSDNRQQQRGEMLARLMYMRECCDHLALVSPKYTGKNSKLQELLRILEDIGTSNENKVVIFTEFQRMLEIISDQITVPHELLYGAMSQDKRILAINRFKTDPECNVFISTSAGDVGLNLQAASFIVNYDIHWNPAKLQQRIGRLHRIGQKQTVTCINLVTKDTIEERILRVLSEKTLLFRKVIDGDFSTEQSESLIWQVLADEFKDEEIWGI